jgi:hypothetical protein
MRILASLTPRRLPAHATIAVLKNNIARVGRRPWRPAPPTARTAAAVIATAVLAVLVAACGGSSSSTGSGGLSNAEGSTSSQSPTAQLLAFSRCMRSHGVPNFPDPSSSGQLPKIQLVQIVNSNPGYPAATQACRNLLPNGVPGSQPTQAQTLQVLSELRNFSQCMRSHATPNWPDPTLGPDGRPTFNLPAGITAHAEINSNGEITSPQISSKIRDCEHVLPAGEYLPPFSPS